MGVSSPVCEGSRNGTVEEDDKKQGLKYFGISPKTGEVGMRVVHKGRSIGKFTHRITTPSEKLRRSVVANYLVEVVTHYGGRTPTEARTKHLDMNLRSLHEVFQALPEFPDDLARFLDEYTPAKEGAPVPEVYREFIMQTWEDTKDKVSFRHILKCAQ